MGEKEDQGEVEVDLDEGDGILPEEKVEEPPKHMSQKRFMELKAAISAGQLKKSVVKIEFNEKTDQRFETRIDQRGIQKFQRAVDYVANGATAKDMVETALNFDTDPLLGGIMRQWMPETKDYEEKHLRYIITYQRKLEQRKRERQKRANLRDEKASVTLTEKAAYDITSGGKSSKGSEKDSGKLMQSKPTG